MLLLFIGAYATHVADKQVNELRVTKKRMNQLKRSLSENDYFLMKMTLAHNNSGSKHDHTPNSGSLIVKGGQVIGADWDGLNSSLDPTTHTVQRAVKEAINHLGTPSLKGCVIYSGTQPCPMCLSLLYLMEIDKIIYFMGSNTVNLTDSELLNQRVYRSLIKTTSERTIPEIILRQEDLK